MSVDLALQLGRLAGVTGFDVALQLSPEQWAAVRDGLRRVFRGHSDLLQRPNQALHMTGAACRLFVTQRLTGGPGR